MQQLEERGAIGRCLLQQQHTEGPIILSAACWLQTSHTQMNLCRAGGLTTAHVNCCSKVGCYSSSSSAEQCQRHATVSLLQLQTFAECKQPGHVCRHGVSRCHGAIHASGSVRRCLRYKDVLTKPLGGITSATCCPSAAGPGLCDQNLLGIPLNWQPDDKVCQGVTAIHQLCSDWRHACRIVVLCSACHTQCDSGVACANPARHSSAVIRHICH